MQTKKIFSIKHDHIGSLFLSFGGVGRLPKLQMTSVMTKCESDDKVIRPRWRGVQLDKYYAANKVVLVITYPDPDLMSAPTLYLRPQYKQSLSSQCAFSMLKTNIILITYWRLNIMRGDNDRDGASSITSFYSLNIPVAISHCFLFESIGRLALKISL